MATKHFNKYYPYRMHTDDVPPPKSNSRNDIVDYIHETHIFEWYTTYLLSKPLEEVEDIVQELYLQLLETKEERLQGLLSEGEVILRAYVVGMVVRQIKSVHSQIWRKIRKPFAMEITQDELFWEKYYDEH